MRVRIFMTRRCAALLFLTLLMAIFNARSLLAQQCTTVEVNCSKRLSGQGPIRCVASITGNYDGALTYQWSVSLLAPIKNHGFPDQVEVDLGGFPHETAKITVTVKGLPDSCDNAATFESRSLDEPEPQAVSQPTSQPTIIASCSEEVLEGMPLSFNAQISDTDRKEKRVYRWTVSRGAIKSGQGTSAILVDTTDLGNQVIRATVTINGLIPVSCSAQVKAKPKAYKLDEYSGSLSLEEKKARLYKLFLRLKVGLDERAYIIA